MATRRAPQRDVVHVEDSDAARQAQEDEVARLSAPVALDEDERVEPDPNSTLASSLPPRPTADEQVIVVDDVDTSYAAPDYTPVIVEEPDRAQEFRVVRINDDYDPFYFGPDLVMSFQAGKRYSVHREIANMLERKGMVV